MTSLSVLPVKGVIHYKPRSRKSIMDLEHGLPSVLDDTPVLASVIWLYLTEQNVPILLRTHAFVEREWGFEVPMG